MCTGDTFHLVCQILSAFVFPPLFFVLAIYSHFCVHLVPSEFAFKQESRFRFALRTDHVLIFSHLCVFLFVINLLKRDCLFHVNNSPRSELVLLEGFAKKGPPRTTLVAAEGLQQLWQSPSHWGIQLIPPRSWFSLTEFSKTASVHCI